MKLIEQPNRWSCLPTSFAMVLDVQVGMLIKKLGHDGSEVIWPELPEPENRRSFHIQELISYAWWLGYSVTPFEPYPRSITKSTEPYKVPFEEGHQERLLMILKSNRGVITGRTPAGGYHAVAWDNERGKILNPNGMIESLENIAINTFWAIANK